MKKYKQLKDLPFTKSGSVWKIDGKAFCKININGDNYDYIGFAKAMVEYYTSESNKLNMADGVWFERLGTKAQKEAQRQEEIRQLKREKQYLNDRIEEIDGDLENL